jgi:hypothetical protein
VFLPDELLKSVTAVDSVSPEPERVVHCLNYETS